MPRKVRIENGAISIVVKKAEIKSTKEGTIKIADNVELFLPGWCIAYGVPMPVSRVVVY